MLDPKAFEEELLRFIGELCIEHDGAISRDTPLFEQGLVDSRRVVDLMEFVERTLDLEIPDDKLSMEYFRSAADIVREFCGKPGCNAPPPAAPALLVFGRGAARPSRDGVAAMVARGDITADDNGCVSLRGSALALHGWFAQLFANLAEGERAEPRRYPSLLPLSDLQRTDYFKSFPQHATFCTCLHHDGDTLQAFVADVKAGQAVSPAAGGRLEAPAAVLSSALCYHCWREFAGRTLDAPLTVLTTQGRCFRNERGAFRTLDRCYEFTMREIVLLGDATAVDERRLRLLTRTLDLAASLGMAGRVEVATDYFFRGDVEGRGRTLHQRANALKYELRVRMDEADGSLAVASFNLHEDYFGRAFDIRSRDGGPAATGCVGFGIERWVSAFLAYHGADPARWPDAARAACGPRAAGAAAALPACPAPNANRA